MDHSPYLFPPALFTTARHCLLTVPNRHSNFTFCYPLWFSLKIEGARTWNWISATKQACPVRQQTHLSCFAFQISAFCSSQPPLLTWSLPLFLVFLESSFFGCISFPFVLCLSIVWLLLISAPPHLARSIRMTYFFSMCYSPCFMSLKQIFFFQTWGCLNWVGQHIWLSLYSWNSVDTGLGWFDLDSFNTQIKNVAAHSLIQWTFQTLKTILTCIAVLIFLVV